LLVADRPKKEKKKNLNLIHLKKIHLFIYFFFTLIFFFLRVVGGGPWPHRAPSLRHCWQLLAIAIFPMN
jgi:hypothetical protein